VCLLDAYLTRLNIPGLDWVIGLTPVAMVFTSFAVSGVTNAINIIDGLHGLASGSVAIMLAGLGTLAWLQQDTLVMTLCIMGSGSAFGFMALNYPFGKVFLGDGGAYLLGFWLAECAVLLAARNPKVSPSAVLLACLYPIWETAFSMYRRLVVKRVSCSHPDKLHLHHLLLRRIIEQRLEGTPAAWVSHSVTSAAIWTMVFGCQMAALASQTSQVWAAAACIVFVITYQTLYTNTAKGFRPSADAEEPKLGPSGWSGLA
jgi:UDP-N-acetylmuramyl pentapeptide phosphotransferase/UDP-N-acetylglucosamine-1-phosphate transferase